MTIGQHDRRAFLAAAGMIVASGAAVAFRPRLVASAPQAKLEQMLPEQFGVWKTDREQAQSVVSPEVQQMIETLYTDTLSRVYLGPNGQRIMLALAYGRDQNRDLQVHKPEVCYVAQGFQLLSSQKSQVATGVGEIPSMRLVAKLGSRVEPITYWIRVGDKVIRGWLEQNVARVELGFAGKLPDGLLVRVSSVDSDVPNAFASQQRFASDMMAAIPAPYRPMFVGGLAA